MKSVHARYDLLYSRKNKKIINITHVVSELAGALVDVLSGGVRRTRKYVVGHDYHVYAERDETTSDTHLTNKEQKHILARSINVGFFG